jgi:ABC-2 type transport system permease protein
MYGYALTLDVKNVRTVVYDQDGTALSRDFLARFQESGYFTVVAIARSYAEAERLLEAGRAQVGLVIPPHFGRDLDLGRRVPVQAFLDGSDSNTATLALAYLEGITGRYSDRILTERAGLAHPGLPVETRLRVWYNPELESRNYIIPGLIAVIMMVIAARLTSLTVAREWEQGTMEQLIATPNRVPELVLGKGLLDVTLAVLAGTLVFGVPFRGNVALLLGLALLFLLGAQSLGLLISIKARSQVVASQVALTVTFLPGFLLSGFIFDIGNLPPWLQAITFAVPARYFVTILKGIFLKGVGLQVLGLDAAFLALFALAVTAAAHRAFRKNLE